MIKRELMYQNDDNGGLRVPNVDVMIKSLRCNYDLKFLEQTDIPQFYKSIEILLRKWPWARFSSI